MPEHQVSRRRPSAVAEQNRIEQFAARFLAETYGTLEPTDGAMAAVFAPCVRPVDPSYYPAIRDRINAIVRERIVHERAARGDL
jgi:hypothetical protein